MICLCSLCDNMLVTSSHRAIFLWPWPGIWVGFPLSTSPTASGSIKVSLLPLPHGVICQGFLSASVPPSSQLPLLPDKLAHLSCIT